MQLLLGALFCVAQLQSADEFTRSHTVKILAAAGIGLGAYAHYKDNPYGCVKPLIVGSTTFLCSTYWTNFVRKDLCSHEEKLFSRDEISAHRTELRESLFYRVPYNIRLISVNLLMGTAAGVFSMFKENIENNYLIGGLIASQVFLGAAYHVYSMYDMIDRFEVRKRSCDANAAPASAFSQEQKKAIEEIVDEQLKNKQIVSRSYFPYSSFELSQSKVLSGSTNPFNSSVVTANSKKESE